MNQLKNRVQLIGHLGKDPQVRQLEQDKKVAQFSLATSESYKNAQGEQVTDTQWHQVVCWGRLAELAEQYLQKGKQIALEGKLSYRSYEDKQGVKRFVTEVVASELLMLGKKEDSDQQPKDSSKPLEDDLPF